MHEHEFIRTSHPSEIIGTPQESLFDTNLLAAQTAADVWDKYRMPDAGQQATAELRQTDTGLTRVRYAQETVPGLEQAVQNNMVESYDYVRASMTDDTEKKNGATHLIVVGVEIAAVALLARLGLKHLAKSGAGVVGEAETVAKSLGAKLNVRPRSFTPSPIVDAPPSGVTPIATHPMPRIRTTERETGPLRVG